MIELHLCDTCTHEFATCGGDMTFAVDIEPHRIGAEADMVVKCKNHKITVDL